MRIQSINVENFLGVRSAYVECASAVTLVAGANGAGKSSIRDAVALALTGDLGRVHLKKDAGQLVHVGQAGGFCEVTDADGDVFTVALTEGGKLKETRGSLQDDPTLPYVLDAQRFARMPVTDRRAFLFGLMNISMKPAEIKSRLVDRLFPAGCNETQMMRIDRVLPLLRTGFDAAADEAKSKATAAKGAWRAITGETYGAVKAIDWKAPTAAFDQAAFAAAQNALAKADEAVSSAQRALGELQAGKKAHDEQLARIEGLKEAASKVDRIKAKLAKDEEDLKTWGLEVVRLRSLVGDAPRVGLVHTLARALDHLVSELDPEGTYKDAQSALDEYEREHGKVRAKGGDAEARALLPAAEKSLNLYSAAVVNDKRDLAFAERAAEDLKTIQAATWSAAPLSEATQQLVDLQAAKTKAAATLEALRTGKLAAEGAKKKTADAAAQHLEVEAWDAIGKALAPDGIPAQLLAEAIAPINARLEQSAADAEWPVALIGDDMAITAAGRPYSLLSESEQWRVDAMVAEAIAHLSEARLLVLDRIDVLDPQKGRGDLFAWLDVLAENGEIDSALLFGTFKALPSDLPATVTAHWIERGVVAQPMKAAA